MSIDPLSASHVTRKLPLQFISTNMSTFDRLVQFLSINLSTLDYHVADATEDGGNLRDVDRPAAVHVERVERRHRLRVRACEALVTLNVIPSYYICKTSYMTCKALTLHAIIILHM